MLAFKRRFHFEDEERRRIEEGGEKDIIIYWEGRASRGDGREKGIV